MSGDPAFERWVARQLHKMYDEVLAEEVPADLLQLVDRVSAKGSSAADGDDGVGGEARGPDAAGKKPGPPERQGQ